MLDRISRLVEAMAARGLDAAVLHASENIRYLTGYTGEGCLFVAKDAAIILTDFRYTEQAGRQAPECEVVQTTAERRAGSILADLVQERSLSTLAIEEHVVTVSHARSLKESLPQVELVSLQGLPDALRAVKDEEEIACIRKAAQISDQAFSWLLGILKPGMTEKQIQIELDYAMLRAGSEDVAFHTIACAGPNGSLPHAIPSDRPVQNGDLLTLDFGAQWMGYKSDITRTVAFGQISSQLRDVYDTVLEAQLAALAVIKPGLTGREVDAVARNLIDAKYPGAFGHSLGHGVGLYVHEQPSMSRLSEEPLRAGHVVTVEPGIYIPGLGGCRIEDTVVLTETGYENFMTAPKQLITI